MTTTSQHVLAALGLSLALLTSSPWIARADVIPSCGPGQSWHSRPARGGVGHSGACEVDPAQLVTGAACCLGALLLLGLGQWLVLRRGPTSRSGTSSREP